MRQASEPIEMSVPSLRLYDNQIELQLQDDPKRKIGLGSIILVACSLSRVAKNLPLRPGKPLSHDASNLA